MKGKPLPLTPPKYRRSLVLRAWVHQILAHAQAMARQET